MEDFQEFPKCLYLNGDVLAEYVVVADAEEEAAKTELGYVPAGEVETQEAAPRKPGRPRKAE